MIVHCYTNTKQAQDLFGELMIGNGQLLTNSADFLTDCMPVVYAIPSSWFMRVNELLLTLVSVLIDMN